MSVAKGFSVTMGVLLALGVVIVGLPILFCSGLLGMGAYRDAAEAVRITEERKKEAADRKAEEQRVAEMFERVRKRREAKAAADALAARDVKVPPVDPVPKPVEPQVDPAEPVAADATVEEVPKETTDEPVVDDSEAKAARKLKLARQFTGAKRRKWLGDVAKEFPGTQAAKDAAAELKTLKD